MGNADRHLTLRRDEHSGEVLARGGAPETDSILERSGFVLVHRVHEHYHRLPTGLDEAAENRLATRAVARLRTMGYHVATEAAFDTHLREPQYLSLGDQVRHLGDQVRHLARQIDEATTTAEVAEVLTELTATHDGILAGLSEVLLATAAFYQDLGNGADPPAAARLRHQADHRLAGLGADLAYTRNELADRHHIHPQRPGRECSNEIGPDEREASATCACPPPRPATASVPRRR